jgi:hypothetical protein
LIDQHRSSHRIDAYPVAIDFTTIRQAGHDDKAVNAGATVDRRRTTNDQRLTTYDQRPTTPSQALVQPYATDEFR